MSDPVIFGAVLVGACALVLVFVLLCLGWSA